MVQAVQLLLTNITRKAAAGFPTLACQIHVSGRGFDRLPARRSCRHFPACRQRGRSPDEQLPGEVLALYRGTIHIRFESANPPLQEFCEHFLVNSQFA
ncbi:hypothetical protein Y032_0011g1547 [Ancylostoma ceylanicum]|uniref:Uncharacterized protein n=1 Tax=Ancylostoma ceylanicum TaxID=53326 RepID=A0A016VFB3_9BILA|nr:hypothetical protein Y032_0011g1547 [Ancylostoma ceylanicum]